MKHILPVLGIALAGAAAMVADNAPGPNTYELAERFAGGKLQNMLFSTTVDPNWFKSGNKFWYTYKTAEGKRWMVVDPTARSRKPMFDHDKMASRLTEIVGDPYIAANLPIEDFDVEEDGVTYTFMVVSSQDAKPKPEPKAEAADTTANDSVKAAKPKPKSRSPKKGGKEKFFFSYDSRTGTLTHLKDKEEEPERPSWANISPDGQTVVYAKDLNLYRMSRGDYEKLRKDENDSTVNEIQLTQDGVKDFGYGQPRNMLNTDTLLNGKRRGVYGVWSPDSRRFAMTVTDARPVKELWVINSIADPRPTLETYKYQMPGEMEAPEEHLYIFDMTDNSRKEVNTSRFKNQTLEIAERPMLHRQRSMDEVPYVWLGDSERMFVTRSSRDLHRIDICSYTMGQDTLVPLIEERMNTYQEVRPLSAIANGKELIEWSERDGWAHLYLYDGEGNLKRRLTEGPWHVHRILKVDEPKRKVYFTAMGREKGENPYYQHLYSVGLDGGTPKRLDAAGYFNSPQVDDDARYFVNNYSRVDTVPETALYDVEGRKVMDLERSDFSQLLANGYKFPEQFTVKAADGVTDLWGVMYKPFDFDPEKKYPIIDYVYPGPQVEATNYPFTRMTVRTDRLAQGGFVVVTVGNRGGHPNRSKWYHNYGYGNLRDYGLADQKHAIEQLAARHKYIDINRVGIHGHSGGGFMSTAAMLQYPDFFKVAVSCAGNHDNRIYNRWWSETHHGVKERVSEQGDTTFVYHIKTNPEIARNLKGNLMLVHGEIDNNVHPANTMRVVDALIRANKRFDMLWLPTQRHSFGNMDEYFYWRMMDYFSDHLKGQRHTEVDIPRR